jgi:hypothetical protein
MLTKQLRDGAVMAAKGLMRGEKTCCEWYTSGLVEYIGHDWEQQRKGNLRFTDLVTGLEEELVQLLKDAFIAEGVDRASAIANANTYIRASRRAVLYKAEWRLSKYGARADIAKVSQEMAKLLEANPEWSRATAYNKAVATVNAKKRNPVNNAGTNHALSTPSDLEGFYFRGPAREEKYDAYREELKRAADRYLLDISKRMQCEPAGGTHERPANNLQLCNVKIDDVGDRLEPGQSHGDFSAMTCGPVRESDGPHEASRLVPLSGNVASPA